MGRLQFGVALFPEHPTHGNFTVRINKAVAFLLFQQGQSMNNGQKFTNVVGAFPEGALSKQFLVGLCIDPTVFHDTGITTGGCIYRNGIQIGLTIFFSLLFG